MTVVDFERKHKHTTGNLMVRLMLSHVAHLLELHHTVTDHFVFAADRIFFSTQCSYNCVFYTDLMLPVC